MLGQHFAVQGDTAAEGHSRKMGATRAFFFGPLTYGREDSGKALIEEIQEGVVGANNLQAGTIFLAKAFFESGAEQAARIVLTNQTGSLSVAQFKTEICNELTALFNAAYEGYVVPLQSSFLKILYLYVVGRHKLNYTLGSEFLLWALFAGGNGAGKVGEGVERQTEVAGRSLHGVHADERVADQSVSVEVRDVVHVEGAVAHLHAARADG